MDNDEFCKKIKEYEGAMYSVSYSILKNDEDCADALSEAIMKAYKNLSSLKSSQSFKAWILKIVHNTSIETVKKRGNNVDIEDQYDVKDEGASLEKTQTKIALRDAVESLKQPYRTVVFLFYYNDLTIFDISAITGTTVPNVKKQLSRGREMLREILSKEDFF